MTEFKVGDKVRHKDFPSLIGEVYETEGGFVCYKLDTGGAPVGYPLSEVEHVHAAEEDWKGYVGTFDIKSHPEDESSAHEWKVDWKADDPHQDLVNHMGDLLQDWKDTFDKKQRAYGSHAIAGSPFGAEQGLVTRMHDKMSRLVQLVNNPDVDDIGEAKRDTASDFGIYAAMLVLVLEGKWPGV